MTINEYSLMKPLLLFYVLQLSANTNGLVNKRLTELINSNKILRHLIGFAVMVVLVSLCEVGEIEDAIMYACVGYMLFILTSKMNGTLNVIVLLLLFIGYFYETYLRNKITKLCNDHNADEIIKVRAYEKCNGYIRYFSIFVVAIIFFGVGLYSIKKCNKYEKTFDLYNFFFV